MPDIIALPTDDAITDALTTTGLPGEEISVAAADGLVCIEIDDHGVVANIYLRIAAMDQFIQQCQVMREEAARRTVGSRVKWLAGPAGQKAYADRLQAAQTAFLALDAVPREQAAYFLTKLGTSAAPSGSHTFANCVRMLDERYGIREASNLFETDLRAIAGMSDFERGTDRTTRQIEQAPKDAVYVCPSVRSISYHRKLAVYLGRQDLVNVSPYWFTDQSWRGRRRSVILDHATLSAMNDRQIYEYRACMDYLSSFDP